MRSRIQDDAPGTLTVTQVVTDADGGLTDLLGPAEDERPGFGGRAAHAHTTHVIHGTFTSPAYLTATPRGQGMFTLGGDGRPEVKAQEALPFTLTLPAGSKKNLPLVLFQHGVNADRAHMFAASDTLAAAGAATLGVDLPMHGDRQPELQDVLHNVTGEPGPDGMADRKAFLASTYMFGLLLYDVSLPAYHPHLARDAFRQGVVDHLSALRAFAEGDLGPLRESHPELAELSFDTTRVSLIGQSLGAIVGGITLAMEPRIGRAALVVGGGGLIPHLATKSPTYARTIVAILAVPLGFEYGVFEYEEFPPWYLPEFQLYQWAIEPGDPLAYAPYALRAPREARPPADVLFMAAFSDESVPNQSSEALAGAYGVSQVVVEGVTMPAIYATPTPPEAQTPFTANVQTPVGKATAALYIWDPAAHDLLIEPGGRRQYKPGFPAFHRLDVEEVVENPVARVQAVVTEFLLGEAGPDGRARAIAP
jgi:pimeloyl-ACP methyl ester carboxylesterase